MSKIVTSGVVYNINYKNKIEKMKKLSTRFSSLSNISTCPQRLAGNHLYGTSIWHPRHRREDHAS